MARTAAPRPPGRQKMKDMPRSVAAILAVLCVASGCAGPAPTAVPATPPSGGSAATSSAVASAAMPTGTPAASRPDVPSRLPVMRGAKPADPVTVPAEVIARWIVDTSGASVYRFYLDALPAAGFGVREELPGGTVAIIRFATPDGMTLDLVLVGEGNGSRRTRIDLVVPEGQ